MMKLNINSETGKLTNVIMADISVFYLTEPINITQEKYYKTKPPKLSNLLKEQKAFVQVLQSEGVCIHWATSLFDCPFQHATRDIGFVVGGTFIYCRMRRSIRSKEIEGIKDVELQMEGNIVTLANGFIEGGDVLIDGDAIFIGLSQRTDYSGIESLGKIIGNRYHIIPLKLKPEFLHLDTVMNILPHRKLLLYPPAFDDISKTLLQERFELIDITAEEQDRLGTNVLTLSTNVIVTDKRNTRINVKLKEIGFLLYELDCSDTTKIGRSFRCCTLPLLRL